MKIDFNKNQDNLIIYLDGRIDTVTAIDFDDFLKSNLAGVKFVTIDCEKLTYISSAGLRVLLSLKKKLASCLTLINVQELVMEIFEVTGFVDILEIK